MPSFARSVRLEPDVGNYEIMALLGWMDCELPTCPLLLLLGTRDALSQTHPHPHPPSSPNPHPHHHHHPFVSRVNLPQHLIRKPHASAITISRTVRPIVTPPVALQLPPRLKPRWAPVPANLVGSWAGSPHWTRGRWIGWIHVDGLGAVCSQQLGRGSGKIAEA